MTVDMHALRQRRIEPSSDEADGAPDSDGDWSYPFRWHLRSPDVLEETDEEVVGTLFDGPTHLYTAQMLLDAEAPEDGARLRAALNAGRGEEGTRWTRELLHTIIGVLSRIPDPMELGGAIPRLDEDVVERLSDRLPLTEFYMPAPVTLEQKREALLLWIHNAGVARHFFAKALKHGCDVAY